MKVNKIIVIVIAIYCLIIVGKFLIHVPILTVNLNTKILYYCVQMEDFRHNDHIRIEKELHSFKSIISYVFIPWKIRERDIISNMELYSKINKAYQYIALEKQEEKDNFMKRIWKLKSEPEKDIE